MSHAKLGIIRYSDYTIIFKDNDTVIFPSSELRKITKLKKEDLPRKKNVRTKTVQRVRRANPIFTQKERKILQLDMSMESSQQKASKNIKGVNVKPKRINIKETINAMIKDVLDELKEEGVI